MKPRELVGRKLSKTNRMLVTEAYRRGIKFEILPKSRFRMSYKEKSYIVKRGRISLAYNAPLTVRAANMKEVTSRLLRARGYPAPENTVFSKHDIERAWKWAEPILPIVLKPYNGTMGKLVFVNIDNYEEFKQCYEKIVEKHNEVLIEQFVKGDEYRFSFVNKKLVGIANRIPANVVGDGINTVEGLISIKNKEREKRKNPIHKKLKLDKESERVLFRQGYSFDYIPKVNERIYLRNNSNVSTGGDAIDVTNEISSEIKENVRKAVMSIPGLRVCGVDVLINENEFHILEVNTHPMLSMHHHPWEGEKHDAVGKVIDGMFPETTKELI